MFLRCRGSIKEVEKALGVSYPTVRNMMDAALEALGLGNGPTQTEQTKEQKREMRKTNMRIFTTYKKLAWDYLFYYTIDFLFLTQVKNIKAADVVLKNTFNSIFRSIMQIPGNIIVEFLGRKNSLIFANILNCLYMVIIMISRNLVDLIFAEFIGAIAFSIKNIVEPSMLSESIPPSR